MIESTVLLIVVVIIIIFVILFGRRIQMHYGSLRPNGKVTERFEMYEVNPDLIYYISGPDDYPHAIIGVDRERALYSTAWKKRELTSEMLKILVTNMESKTSQMNALLHGCDILDNSGHYIGDWFSVVGIHTAIKIGKDNRVNIYPPPSDVYERN